MKTFVVGATCLGLGIITGFKFCENAVLKLLTSNEYMSKVLDEKMAAWREAKENEL